VGVPQIRRGWSRGRRGPVADRPPVGGFKLWLRSDFSCTGASWLDRSGYGHDATQGTGASQPAKTASNAAFNGHPTLDFTSGIPSEYSHMDIAHHADFANSADGWTCFIVASATESGQTQALLAKWGSDSEWLLQAFNGTGYDAKTVVRNAADSGTYAAGSGRTGQDRRAHVYTFRFSGSGATLGTAIDSDAEVTAAAADFDTTTADLCIGGYNNTSTADLDGSVAEIIFYKRSLSASEIAQVVDYLERRYAITDQPLPITGEYLRFRADKGITFNGTDVSAWAQMAGAAAASLEQGTAAKQPLYNPSVNVAGTKYFPTVQTNVNGLLSSAAAVDFSDTDKVSVFAVIARDTTLTPATLIGHTATVAGVGPGNGFELNYSSVAGQKEKLKLLGDVGRNENRMGASSPDDLNFHAYVCVADKSKAASEALVYQDGTVGPTQAFDDDNADNFSSDTLHVGARGDETIYSRAQFAELVFKKGAFTAAEIAALTAYATTWYGTP
jgi:hypothetical protein